MEGRRFAVLLFLAISIHTVATRRMRLLTMREKICYQPKDPGPCLAFIPRFYYDSNVMTCRSFIYGGCDGNDNRFATRKQCRDYCIRILK
uniref:Gsp_03 putative toxin n=1 Tax=Gemmula speciosa TaxID=439592 RepID=A0A098LXV2_GEMSP